jgi:hypothetical protein
VKRAIVLLTLAAVVGTAQPAEAQRRRVYYGTQDVAGPFKLDIRFGPWLDISDYGANQFLIGLAFGVDLAPGRRHHLHLDFPFEFALGSGFTFVTIMPGIEADLRVPAPIPIFIYPRVGLGLGLFTSQCLQSDPFGNCVAETGSDAGFGLRFGVGVKFLIAPFFHVFIAPMNIYVFPAGFSPFTPVTYELAFGVGFNL